MTTTIFSTNFEGAGDIGSNTKPVVVIPPTTLLRADFNLNSGADSSYYNATPVVDAGVTFPGKFQTGPGTAKQECYWSGPQLAITTNEAWTMEGIVNVVAVPNSTGQIVMRYYVGVTLPPPAGNGIKLGLYGPTARPILYPASGGAVYGPAAVGIAGAGDVHFALVVPQGIGPTARLYQSGTLVWSGVLANSNSGSFGTVCLGPAFFSGSDRDFTVDNFRVSRGEIYTADFTPPASLPAADAPSSHYGWYRGDYVSDGNALFAAPAQDWLDITFTIKVPVGSTLAQSLRILGTSNQLEVRGGSNGSVVSVSIGDGSTVVSANAGAVGTTIGVRIIVGAGGSAIYLNGSSVAAASGVGFSVASWTTGASMFHGGSDNYAGITSVMYIDDLVVQTGLNPPPNPAGPPPPPPPAPPASETRPEAPKPTLPLQRLISVGLDID